MSNRKIHGLIPVLISFWVMAILSYSVLALPETQNTKRSQFVYFWSDYGEFLKVDTETMSIGNQGCLARTNSLASIIPDCLRSPQNYWSIGRVLYDINSSNLYFTLPQKDRSIQKPQIIILMLPSFEIIKTITPLDSYPYTPQILLTPDGKKLFVKYRDLVAEKKEANKIYVDILDIYETNTFRKIKTYKETTNSEEIRMLKAKSNISFSNNAYFGKDGKTIYDRRYIIRLLDDKFEKEEINVRSYLSEAERIQLYRFKGIDPKSASFPFGIVDSKNGCVLISGSNKKGENLFFTINLENRKVSPFIQISFTVSFEFSQDGTTIVFEKLETRGKEKIEEVVIGKTVKRDRDVQYKTGKIFEYDIASGKLLKEIDETKELSGRYETNGIICISPDNKYLFYNANGTLYAVNLIGDVPPLKINASFKVNRNTTYVFTDK